MHALAPASLFRAAGAALVALALALAAVVLVAPAAHAAAQTYTVDSLTDDGVGDTFREAVALANANNGGIDTITFLVSGTVVLDSGPIIITDGVTINGNSSGTTISRSVSQGLLTVDLAGTTAVPDRQVTISDVDFAGASPLTGRALDVIDNTPVDTLSLVRCNFDNFDGAFEGGAIRAAGLAGGVELVNTTFSNNDSTNQAGAVYVSGAVGGVFMSGTTFTNNTATNGGAVVLSGNGPINFINSTLTDNDTNNAGGAGYLTGNTSVSVSETTFSDNDSTNNRGGALYMSGTAGGIFLDNATFDNNTADIDGGAIGILSAGQVDINTSLFTDNEAGGDGGAISFENGGPVTVDDSEFSGNTAIMGGALQFISLDDEVSLDTNIFRSNTASLNGGGITVMDVTEDVYVDNSTFELNVASDPSGSSGGGIWFGNVTSGNQFVVESSTFTRNEAGNAGVSIGADSLDAGGLLGILNSTFFEQDTAPYAINVGSSVAGSTLAIVSSTIVGNGAVHVGNLVGDARISNSIIDGEANGPLWQPVVRDSGTNLFLLEWSIVTTPIVPTSMSAGAGNQFSTEPQLGALAFNGGLTNTMLPAEGSPAINAGDPAYPFTVTEDQRGVARIAYARVDIGAVELQTLALAATGIETSPLLPIGAGLLVLLGLAGLVVARRRLA